MLLTVPFNNNRSLFTTYCDKVIFNRLHIGHTRFTHEYVLNRTSHQTTDNFLIKCLKFNTDNTDRCFETSRLTGFFSMNESDKNYIITGFLFCVSNLSGNT